MGPPQVRLGLILAHLFLLLQWNLLKTKIFASSMFIVFYLQTQEHERNLTNDC